MSQFFPSGRVIPQTVQLRVRDRVVTANCLLCDSFLGASVSLDRLEIAIRAHHCSSAEIEQAG